MTKFLLLLVILATACAAPRSRNNSQEGNQPCVNVGQPMASFESHTKLVNTEENVPTTSHQPPNDTDPTNHYYFSAPLDTVNNKRQEFIEVPDEVRYNIIFVKVPPFVPKVQEEIELQPKTDEKTTVYVLVKRPEDPETIQIEKLKEPKDEKPEVIVVKYNEDKDIQAQIEGIQQSKIFGELGIARTSQVSETQVNGDLKQLKKGDITQLKLVGDTRAPSSLQFTKRTDSRTPSNKQFTKIADSKSGSSPAAEYYGDENGEETNPSSTFNSGSSIKGSSVNNEDEPEYGDEEESGPSAATQRPVRNNLNQETEADKIKRVYMDSIFDANNLKSDKKNQ